MKPCRGFDPGSTPGPGVKWGCRFRNLCPSLLLSSYRPRRGSHLLRDRPAFVAVQSKSLLLNNIILVCRVKHFRLSNKEPQPNAPSSGEMHDITLDLEGKGDALTQSLGSGILTSLLGIFHHGRLLLSGFMGQISVPAPLSSVQARRSSPRTAPDQRCAWW
jgi:hypothetical protein